MRKDFSREKDTFFVRYANRWRLEPGEKVGDLWRPKQPIVYYIDRTVPEQWRPCIKQGIEAWNRGVRGRRLQGRHPRRDPPAGADPADLRYHTVRWITTDQPQFGAIGPSIVDPRTGEILDADILIESGLILSYDTRMEALSRPAARLERQLGAAIRLARRLARHRRGRRLRRLPGGPARRAPPRPRPRTGGSLPASRCPSEYVGEGLRWVAMHEVGHTLGLDHNFRASASTPFERLHDPAWTREHGIAGSVMDYTPLNLAPLGRGERRRLRDQRRPLRPLGDLLRLQPDPEKARQIARLAAQPGHDYGMEEHLDTPGAVDPSLARDDLGADPVAWARERAEIYRALLERLAASSPCATTRATTG